LGNHVSVRVCALANVDALFHIQLPYKGRTKSNVVQNRQNYARFCSQNFLGSVFFPNFETQVIKPSLLPIMWQSFTAIGRRRLKTLRSEKCASAVKHIRPPDKPTTVSVLGGLNTKRVFRDRLLQLCHYVYYYRNAYFVMFD